MGSSRTQAGDAGRKNATYGRTNVANQNAGGWGFCLMKRCMWFRIHLETLLSPWLGVPLM